MKKNLYFLLFFLPKLTFGAVSAKPIFSVSGGFYNSSVETSITAGKNAKIYFTTDGTTPSDKSKLYTNAILVSATTAVRSIAIETGNTPSEVVTHTYFIKEPINMPIISLVTDPANFFSNQTGIYVKGTNGIRGSCDPVVSNVNQDWERPVNIELYEKNGKMALNQMAGIKIFGGCSRTRFPQKSFALYARKSYGKPNFDYQIFPDKNIKKFESFLLRSSADDQVRTMFRDAFTAYSVRDFMDIDYMAYRPAAVFINGQYWGIHNMREKVNEHYLEDNFDVKEEEINLLERNSSEFIGDNDGYNKMIDFVSNTDLSVQTSFDAVSKLIDLNQFIDYEIANIHLAEVDWPGNNIKFWNGYNSQYEKWRWILFDRDQSYLGGRINTDALALATATNGPSWPNPPWSTVLLRRLLFNKGFRTRFIQTYSYHLATAFEPKRVSAILDIFKAGIAAEIPRHITKWGGKLDLDKTETWPIPTFNSVAQWETNVAEIRNFLPNREAVALKNLRDYFAMPDERSEIVFKTNIANAGEIKHYDKTLPEGFKARFFNNITLKLSAFSKNGYRFSHWEVAGKIISTDEIEFLPIGNSTITAHFKENPGGDLSLVINEINYNSAPKTNSGDWVELYNPNSYKMNISGWKINDSDVENIFTFRNNTIIEPNGYLVVCDSLPAFTAIFPKVTNRVGGLGFKFSNGGEAIKLFNSANVLIDLVEYSDKKPWVEAADGQGSSLELIDEKLNNNVAENWKPSLKNGSPGQPNREPTLATEKPNANMLFSLNQNFPNPVSDEKTTLNYEILKTGNVILKIFDLQGREVETVVNKVQQADKYEILYDATHLEKGMYFVVLQFDNTFVEVNKMLVLK